MVDIDTFCRLEAALGAKAAVVMILVTVLCSGKLLLGLSHTMAAPWRSLALIACSLVSRLASFVGGEGWSNIIGPCECLQSTKRNVLSNFDGGIENWTCMWPPARKYRSPAGVQTHDYVTAHPLFCCIFWPVHSSLVKGGYYEVLQPKEGAKVSKHLLTNCEPLPVSRKADIAWDKILWSSKMNMKCNTLIAKVGTASVSFD